jgi:hypothetical protein
MGERNGLQIIIYHSPNNSNRGKKPARPTSKKDQTSMFQGVQTKRNHKIMMDLDLA